METEIETERERERERQVNHLGVHTNPHHTLSRFQGFIRLLERHPVQKLPPNSLPEKKNATCFYEPTLKILANTAKRHQNDRSSANWSDAHQALAVNLFFFFVMSFILLFLFLIFFLDT